MSPGTSGTSQVPRVRRNEWQRLTPPALGAGEPSLSVSVVIPAYDAGRLLPFVLAGLAAQTYPAHLLEVVVVDDGPAGPGEPGRLELPELRPERTRIVTPETGWGRANACHTGALAAEGGVLPWLAADVLVERPAVEAQLRWHHLLDHVAVLGTKWFVDPAPVLARTPAEVHAAVTADQVGSWWAEAERTPHTWVEEIYARTDDLRDAGWFALRTHTGATASVRRRTYLDAGGMDTTLRLGEDISLGARLAEEGCVFVPDREALSWHLGPTHVMGRREAVNAYNDPFFASSSPTLRAKRFPGRTYDVPCLDVVVGVDAAALDAVPEPDGGPDGASSGGLEVLAEVTATVDAVLASSLHDLRVTLLVDADDLPGAAGERIAVLDAPALGRRILAATYADEPRVRLLPTLPPDRPDTPFRLHLPGTRFAPRRTALEALLLHLEHTHDGLRIIDLPDGTTARLVRTAAVSRARRVAGSDQASTTGWASERDGGLDDLLDELAGSGRVGGREVGFARSLKVRPAIYPRTGGRALSAEQAWARIDEQLAPRGLRRHGGGDG